MSLDFQMPVQILVLSNVKISNNKSKLCPFPISLRNRIYDNRENVFTKNEQF